MQKFITYLMGLVLMLLINQAASAQARQNKQPFIESLIKQDRTLQKDQSAVTAEPDVVANMNAHREAYLDLRAQVRTPEQLSANLNARRSHAGSGSIAGTVYESDGLRPAQSYVHLRAYDEFGSFVGSASVFPWDNGLYVIEDLAAGRFFVAAAEFSETHRTQYYNKVADWRDATLVEVFEGQPTPGIDFALEKNINYPSGSGAISGSVRDDQNRPLVAAAFIEAFDENRHFVTSRSVDGSGNYFINGLGTGSYKLRVTYSGEENLLSEWFDGARLADDATPVLVTDANTTAGIDFTLEAGGAINLKVLAPEGQIITDRDTRIIIFDSDFRHVNVTTRFAEGEFTLSRLESGTYFLNADYFGPENYVETWLGNAADTSETVPVFVGAPDTVKGLTITLIRGGEIQGTVSYSGEILSLGHVWVTAFDEQRYARGYVQIRADGSYAMRRLRPGRYRLFAAYSSNALQPSRRPAFQWFDDADSFEAAQVIVVSEAPPVAQANIILKRGGYISGQILTSNGQPFGATGEMDCYTRNQDRVSSSGFGSDGYYIVGGLRTGEYKLLMNLHNPGDFPREWYDSQLAFESATPVSVIAPNATPGINFTPETVKKIGGFVGTAAGQQLTSEAAFLQVYAFEANTGDYFSFTTNSFNGGFTLQLFNGEYKVAATSIFSNDDPRQDSLAATWAAIGTSFDDSNTQRFVVSDDQTFVPAAITMSKANGGLAGTAFRGSPPRPVTQRPYLLFAFDELGFLVKVSRYFSSLNPIDGSYWLTGLRPGRYFILAALLRSESLDDMVFTWLGGAASDLTAYSFTPHVEIPAGATAVSVNESIVGGNDIFFDFSTGVDARDASHGLATYRLLQNYPNPFNPTTTIAYELPKQSHVTISVFDLSGRLVETLVEQSQTAGSHRAHWHARGVPTGVYFIRMRAGEFVQTRKGVLMR